MAETAEEVHWVVVVMAAVVGTAGGRAMATWAGRPVMAPRRAEVAAAGSEAAMVR